MCDRHMSRTGNGRAETIAKHNTGAVLTLPGLNKAEGGLGIRHALAEVRGAMRYCLS